MTEYYTQQLGMLYDAVRHTDLQLPANPTEVLQVIHVLIDRAAGNIKVRQQLDDLIDHCARTKK